MGEGEPRIKSQAELNAAATRCEHRIYDLSTYLSGKVDKTILQSLEDSWGEIVQGKAEGGVIVSATPEMVESLEGIYNLLVQLGRDSGVSKEDMNPEWLKVNGTNPKGDA